MLYFYVFENFTKNLQTGKMFTLKHGARIGGDEPIVNFAAVLKESDKVDEARVTFGLFERPFLAKNVSEFLVGK